MFTAIRNYRTALYTALVWAGYYFFASLCSRSLSPMSTGFLIRLICLIMLGAYMMLRSPKLFRIRGKAVLWMILIGFNGFMLDYTAFMGFRSSSVAVGTLLLKSDVIMVNIVTVLLTRQRFKTGDWFFTLVALTGVFLVLDVPLDGSSFFRPQSLYFVASAVFVTFNVFVIRHAQAAFAMKPETIGFYNNGISMLWFLGGLLILDPVSLPDTLHAAGAIGPLLAMTALGQSLIYIFYYQSIERYPIWLVKVVLLLVPVLSSIADFAGLGHRLSWKVLTGAAMVLIGASGILLSHRDGNDGATQIKKTEGSL